jgi:hypothetical protein
MASPNLSEIVTTTLRSRTGKLADNVTKNNALLNRLKRKGNIKPVSGGRTIVQELEYAENSTYIRYSGYQTLDISPSDVMSAAEFDWKQAAVAVSISGLEERINSGSEQVINLLEGRIKNAERTMANNISLDCYSNGTASGGLQIGGLQLLVADTPTNTVGGINRTLWTFWKNQVLSTGTITSSTIQDLMNRTYVKCIRGRDKPDLIITDDTLWTLYLASLQTIQRITRTDEASAGFMELKYMGADVVLDGGIGGGCPADHMYFLNSDYIHFRPHTAMNFAPMGPERFSTNQDAMVKLIGFQGNMTLSNGSLQGVLFET